MGRLLKITEGKCRHSLSQEVDFVNKSLTKVNKAKLKEDRYASLDDELSAIENGGWDMFVKSIVGTYVAYTTRTLTFSYFVKAVIKCITAATVAGAIWCGGYIVGRKLER